MTNHCEQLDRYCDGELNPAQAKAFELHLEGCSPCREVMRLDRELFGMLAEARPQAPPGLVERIEGAARWDRVRRVGLRTALLAASVLLVALGIWSGRGDETPITVRPVEPPPIAETPLDLAEPPVRITFKDDAKVIAVPLKTKNPGVTVVWVYPQLQVAKKHAAPAGAAGPD